MRAINKYSALRKNFPVVSLTMTNYTHIAMMDMDFAIVIIIINNIYIAPRAFTHNTYLAFLCL